MSVPEASTHTHEVRFYIPNGIGLVPSSPLQLIRSPRLGDMLVQPINAKLPTEAFLNIFFYLRPNDLNRVRLVCKLWQTLADDEVFLKQMTEFYTRMVKDNRAERPYYIAPSPAGNIGLLLQRATVQKTTLENYQAAANKFIRARHTKVEQTELFERHRKELQERYPHENNCCACNLKCPIL